MKVKVKLRSPVRLFATPMDCSLPGSSVNGIFQARVLEWDAKPTSIQKKKKKAGAKQHLKVVAKLPEGLSLGKEMPPATEQPDFFAFGPHEGS